MFCGTTIESIQRRSPDLATLKAQTKFIVIDDDPNAFPELSTMLAEGYNITQWPKVESLSQLESGAFDVIILDIQGVAKKWGPGDGLEVLKLLKRNRPTQYIIAFSGQRSIHELEEFWKVSDAQLKKPVPLAECKQKLDDAIRDHANLTRYWDQAVQLLHAAGVVERDIRKLEKHIVKQIRKRDSSTTIIEQLATDFVDDDVSRKRLIAVVQGLITVALHLIK